jgi:pyruvate/2-oxoacid:ferredoxin oxidoreductase alpha subunit
MRQLCKGNVAVVKGAVLAGCRHFYGYPITPASEIAEYAALYIPQVSGTFLQAESEVSAINMCYGAASAGQRVMTACFNAEALGFRSVHSRSNSKFTSCHI